MQVGKEKYSKSFFFSLLLHIIVLIALIASFDFTSKMAVLQKSDQNLEIVNAMVMDAPAPSPSPTKVKPLPQPKHLVPKPVVVKQQTPPKAQEKPEISPPKKQAIAISDKKQKKQEQDKIAKQLLSDIKKQSDQQKKVKEKALAAAFEKEMKQLAAKSIQRQMMQEKVSMTGARTQKMKGEVDKYKALISQAISQNWIIPGSVDKRLSAQLLIRVAPGGVVLDVQVVKSSGDDNLDRSARAAVFKSSPLPVPTNTDEFEPFRQFVLKVKPENVLTSDNLVS
jgi:colicin import membrane protein